ncbi:molybdopterin-binding protein [Bradymonas sediminis]|uniref:Bifunctional molybdenum cofactor biosynthesis protein MoaC/MoaB n=1 Tax=Bradymonas sediminis TaxID=1548548 RepID=A0A2Z4FLT4_9DELT|nr:molybdopterin-binding protein [Bradymonas sediminis]AWV89967.1 bifunctional molybdenum cofactor biosynthesis protein MoaC/MoaB [Bradymonas sediminis]TDP76080.1 cyclic pyranopterin monophosphate synthase subunit MoaC [Bradymonas sediminis]
MHQPRQQSYARAQAYLRAAEIGESFGALRERLDGVMHAARAAGMLAARRAGEFIPDSHHAELEVVELNFAWEDGRLRITAQCQGRARAGLGARALLAANICAVSMIEALSDVAEHLIIEDARIVEQTGGAAVKSYRFDPPLRAAVMVTSNAVVGGHKEDRAGGIVRQAVEALAPDGVELGEAVVMGDDARLIEEAIARWVADGFELIVTVGGTGVLPSDVTVDTVDALLQRPIPGIMEAARAYGQSRSPVAFMSRGVAGLIGDTLVLTLPGSRGGARETCEALFPSILHVAKTLRRSRALR